MTDTITVHLTPGELLEAYHALKQQTRFTTTEQRANNESAAKKLKEAYINQEASALHTCGECAHLRHLNPKKDSYNREAYAKRPWGDCPIYERSPEYQSMVKNHCYGCGWTHAPGRAFDQPACQHFTPKKP